MPIRSMKEYMEFLQQFCAWFFAKVSPSGFMQHINNCCGFHNPI